MWGPNITAKLQRRRGPVSATLRAAHPLPARWLFVPPTTLAVVDLGSNSFRLEIGRVEGDQIYQLDTWRETLRLGAGLDAKGRLKPAAMQTRARLPRALPRTAVRAASRGGARGRDQHLSRRHERPRVPGARRAHDRIPDRRHQRPRGGAAHLLRRRARAAALAGAAARHRHRRRFDRVHHRPRPAAGAARVADDRLRRDDAALLSERRDHGRGDGRRGNGGARRDRGDRARLLAPSHWREAYASSGTAMALADILEQNAFSGGRHHADGTRRVCAATCSPPATSHG